MMSASVFASEDSAPRVVFETDAGAFTVEVLVDQAPVSGANFLEYVDANLYDGATLYRVVRAEHGNGDPSAIEVVQGGLLGDSMNGGSTAMPEPPRPAIAHETTDKTGILNERGTIAYARLAPGTAGSEFFVNMKDNPSLDTGDTRRQPDGQGYAAFGRVVAGMDVLEKIQAMPTSSQAASPIVRGQLLSDQVVIERVYRAKTD